MGRMKYKPEDIIQHLRTWELEQLKGGSKEEAARRVGINYQMLCRWKKEYGGLRVDQAKRLKDLEMENQRLKRLVADLSVDNQILKEVSKGNF